MLALLITLGIIIAMIWLFHRLDNRHRTERTNSEHHFHICAFRQRQDGSLDWFDGIVSTNADPVEASGWAGIREHVAKQFDPPAEKFTINCFTKLS